MTQFSDAVKPISAPDVLVCFGLIAIVMGLSTWRRLGLVRDLAIGTIRTVVQLSIIGYVILFLFQIDSAWLTCAVLLTMVAFAGWTALRKCGCRKREVYPLTSLSIFAGSGLTLAYVLWLVVDPPQWSDPQYIIPLAGMIIGNAMNGTALAIERLQSEVRATRGEIEVRLSLGATRLQAASEAVRRAISAALIPSINSMMVVGLVLLPGMMTGQILAGTNPIWAAKYQMVVMFMLPAATALSVILVVFLFVPRIFTSAHQLREEAGRMQ
jgi:putative ABC transport system permease protein